MRQYLLSAFCVLLTACGSDSSVEEKLGDELIDTRAVTTSLHDKIGASVVMDAHEVHCGHDSDHSLGYSWNLLTKPSGSSAALNAKDLAKAGFTADSVGTYEAELDLTCLTYAEKKITFTVEITSLSENAQPVAQTPFILHSAKQGSRIQLDGSGSYDKDGDVLTYLWTLSKRPTGSSASFDDPTSGQPSFIADVAGEYEYTLVVNDGTVDSDPITLPLTVTPIGQNARPIADAGHDQRVSVGQMVTLHGFGSYDPDGDVITYKWSLNAEPTGSNMLASIYGSGSGFDRTSSEPVFTPTTIGEYTFKLEVSDASHTSVPSVVHIQVEAAQHSTSLYTKLLGMGLDSTDAHHLIDKHNSEALAVANAASPIFGGIILTDDTFRQSTDSGGDFFKAVGYQLTDWQERHKTRFKKMFGRVAFVINSQRFANAFNAQVGLLDPTHQGTNALALPANINNYTSNILASITYPSSYAEFKAAINSVLDDEIAQNNRKLRFYLSTTESGTAYGGRPLRLGVEQKGMMGDANSKGEVWTVNQAAGLAMHELMHSVGYDHDPSNATTTLKPNNIPYFVQIISSYQETDIFNTYCGGSAACSSQNIKYGYPDALLTYYFGNN